MDARGGRPAVRDRPAAQPGVRLVSYTGRQPRRVSERPARTAMDNVLPACDCRAGCGLLLAAMPALGNLSGSDGERQGCCHVRSLVPKWDIGAAASGPSML